MENIIAIIEIISLVQNAKMQVGMTRPIAITKIFYTKIAHTVDMKKDIVVIMKGKINDNKLRKDLLKL